MILNVVIADWTIARLNYRLTKTERRSHDNLIGITSGFSRSGSDCHQPLSAASRVRRPFRKRRSPHFADEVCRVVRAADAGVLRDLWIGTDWPCHVYAVVADS